MYLCVWQTSFFLRVVKQLVWQLKGLLLFHPQIILFKRRRPNTCDFRCFYWIGWWQRRIWMWRSMFSLWLCGSCLHWSCCHPCRRCPLEGSQCSTTVLALQFLRKLFGIWASQFKACRKYNAPGTAEKTYTRISLHSIENKTFLMVVNICVSKDYQFLSCASRQP